MARQAGLSHTRRVARPEDRISHDESQFDQTFADRDQYDQ